jgi:hypothetical protein
MKKIILIFSVSYICLLFNSVWPQTDSIANKKDHKILWYFGDELGGCNKGAVFGLGCTVTSSNLWGGSLSFRTNTSKSDNVPSDYFDDGIRVFAPRDYLRALSLNLVKKFRTSSKYIRIGLEAGPSWVRENIAEFEANPNYDPDREESSWNIMYPNYKYYKSHVATSTIGLSIATKVEFPFIEFLGLDICLYSVINNLQTIVGLDICLDLGRVGY